MNNKSNRKLKQSLRNIKGKIYLGNLLMLINYHPSKFLFNWKQKIVTLILLFNFFTLSTFAIPEAGKMTVVSAGEFGQDIRFSWLSGNLGAAFGSSVLGFFLGNKGNKTKRKTPEKVIILPAGENGNLTVMQGEKINLSAIGMTGDEPLNGLNFSWTITDVTRKHPPRKLNNGNFAANVPGTFMIAAETQGIKAEINIIVNPNEGFGIQKLLEADSSQSITGTSELAQEQQLARINSLKDKKRLISREISSKTLYESEVEERLYIEEKQKRRETEIKQEQIREQLANHSQNPSSENEKIKRGGPNAEDMEGVVFSPVPETTANVYSFQPKMMRPIDEDGWNGSNWWSADDPGNQTGNPPSTSPDAGAGNGNYQIMAPVVALPGRQMDVNLSLSYNSRLWGKSGNTISYDPDKGSPAPGWNIGFGKIMYMGGNGGCMLVDADGTRRGYSGTNNIYNYNGYYSNNFVGHTTDGSFIDYSCYYSSSTYGTYFSGSATLPNGVQIAYYSSSIANDQAFPTQITDAQGNYTTITYIGGRGPNIQTIQDTMGRITNFNYDGLNRLVSITVPGFNGGAQRVAVRLHYTQLNLSYAFSGLTPDTPTNSPYVLDAIYYPGTQTGYWFGDSDSYSSYGMIAKVVEARGMSWSGSGNNDQGTISPGTMSKLNIYNYPMTADGSLTDAPTYTTLTESWAGMDTPPAVTTYNINNNDYHSDGYSNSPCYTTKVTRPNGAISKQYAYRTPGSWTDGLIFADETLAVINGTETVISSSLASWQQGSYDTPRPIMTKSTDELLQTTRIEMTYGANYNQVISKKEFDYTGTLVKEIRTNYLSNANYINRHIFSLVNFNEIYDGNNNRIVRSDYEYDNNIYNGGSTNLKETPGVIMHQASSNPYTTEMQPGPTCLNGQFNYPSYCSYEGEIVWVYQGGWFEAECRYECYEYEQVSAYNPASAYRGNLTKITSYADAQYLTGAISETRQYDVTGNLVAHSNSSNEISTINYDVGTQFAYPASQTEGSSDPNSPLKNTASTVSDFNTGLAKQTVNKNGRTNSVTYNPDNLRPTVSTTSTGSYTQTIYNDAAMSVTEEAYEYGGNLAAKSVKFLNGIGSVVREENLGVNNVWDKVETKYTNLGAVWKQSRPYRNGDTPQWTENVYDIQGRVFQVIEADGSSVQAFFNESARPSSASNLPGQTARKVDAWGRESWERYDKDGKLVEMVEPDPNGNGSVFAAGNLVTKYKVDKLGRLIESEQGTQLRYFKYNSLGQLIRQKLAEQTATLNDAGQYVGAGNSAAVWGEAFTYDDRANITMKIDARGVKTHYSYQLNNANDPLNRIQAKFYDLSGPLDPNLIIHQAPGITYEYMTTGDQMRIKKIKTAGILTEDYSYDVEGRVTDYAQSVDYRLSYPMTTSYIYDSLDRITDVRNPAQYGMAGNPRKLIHNTFDIASRVNSLSVDGQQQLSGVNYDAASRTTSMTIGTAGTNQVTELYTFDNQNGLLTNQKAIRNGQTLMDLTYDYQRNTSNGSVNGKTGNLTKISDNLNHNKDREYQYDAIGRLITSKGGVNSSLWQQTYTYDRYGNRTNVAATGIAADGSPIVRDGFANLSYNTNNNRITTSNGNGQFEYDSAGNQIRALAEDGVNWLKLEYDTANRLQIIRKDDGTYLQAFQFGAGNIRLMSHDYVSNQFTLFATINGSVTAEYTEHTATVPVWIKGYTYLGDKIFSTITPNGSGGENAEYSHLDRLGTRLVTNQQAGTGFEQANLPFGTALDAESTGSTSRRFTTYERSARTGLDYAQNRTYDSKQGRFTQIDPIGMNAVDLRNPQSLNLYSYCVNDPINHTDSDGLFFGFLKKFFSWLGKIIKYIALVIAIVAFVIVVVSLPAVGTWTLFHVFTLIGAVANVAEQVFSLLGLKVLSTIFGVIGAVGSFGSAIVTKAGKLIDLGKASLKAILGVIKTGANLASKVLTALGQNMAGKILGFASKIAGAIDGIAYGTQKDFLGKDILDSAGAKIANYKSAWEWFKTIRGVAQETANLVGAKKVAEILGNLGLIEDIESITSATASMIRGFKEIEVVNDQFTSSSKLVVSKSTFSAARFSMSLKWNNRLGRINFYLENLNKINKGLTGIAGKVGG